MRRTVQLLVLAACCTIAAACGGGDDRAADRDRGAERGHASGRDGDDAPTPPAGTGTDVTGDDAPPPFAAARAGRCAPPAAVSVSAKPAPLGTARRDLDSAADRATSAGHRFDTALAIRAGSLVATAELRGRRLPTNASEATLRWTGLAGTLLPDLDLRIVGDRLFVRRDGTWRELGSASGVALDVGRELLDHPQLLDTRAATRRPNGVTVLVVAPAPRLRAYATSERRGPVTDLLRATRVLTLYASTLRGRYWFDSFQLDTSLPASMQLRGVRPGARIRITGGTAYCPLRASDRAAISAPTATG